MLWPRRGWTRMALYIQHRLGRLPGTPYRIAAGFACGAAISFTPFLGLHFVLAALGALALRGNVVASAFGTVVGNPLTFPIILPWIYTFGRTLLGRETAAELPDDLSFGFIFDRPLEILWPMTVGGVPTAIAAWIITYLIMHRVVSGYQRARRRRRVLKRLRRRARARSRAGAVAAETPRPEVPDGTPDAVPDGASAQEERGDDGNDAIFATRGQH